jgi:hypothetical protein
MHFATNRAVCFLTDVASRSIPSLVPHRLKDRSAQALAELLQILCCGEESAVFAFSRLSRDRRLEASAQATLAAIAADEAVHESRLADLRFSLPPAAEDESLRASLKRFFRSLGSRDLGIHFTRLAALDSGVCAILSALRGTGLPIAQERGITQIVEKIHRDEARHAASALFFARNLLTGTLIADGAAETRQRLVDVVMRRADAMERLGVDPAQMARRLTAIPPSFTW